MTYSITAHDLDTGRFGVAVQSCVFAVGTRVPVLAPGQGALAVQAGFASWYRQPMRMLLAHGLSADQVVSVIAAFPGAVSGQAAVVDIQGGVAAHTGTDCVEAAGHCVGEHAVAAGNLLSNSAVWAAMLDTYAGSRGSFESRLAVALQSGEEAGGDVRGRQSAAILVTGKDADYETDLRVDDSRDPVGELSRLVTVKAAHDELRRALSAGAGWTTERADRLAAAGSDVPDDPLLTVWSAIALALAKRDDEAVAVLRRARVQNPWLTDYLHREPELAVDDRRDRLARLLHRSEDGAAP